MNPIVHVYVRLALLLAATQVFGAAFAQTCTVYLPAPDTSGWHIPPAVVACDTSLIRTDPNDPFNPQSWQRANTFNWIDPNPEIQSYWEEYCLNSSAISSSFVKTPWSQDDNSLLNPLLLSQDKYPKDGWELIKHDLGYTSTGYPSGSQVDYPYVVLYNRFTGILRVFVALSEVNSSFQVARMQLEFMNSPMSSNLDLSTAFTATQRGITALKSFERFPRFQAAARYLDGPGRWLYADFPMMYDPCVCNYNTQMKIEVRLINTAEITMTSIATGSLVPDEQALSSSANIYDDDDGKHTWGWEDLAGFNEKAVQKSAKAYKDMLGFQGSLEEAITDSGLSFAEKSEKLQALSELVNDIKLPYAFKVGLSAMPYVSSALTFLDFFVGGGKEASGPQEVIVQPMAIELNSKYKGTIVSLLPKKDITFNTPGGSDNSPKNANYPAYNEALGVMHLVEEPVLKTNPNLDEMETYALPSELIDPFGHSPFYYPIAETAYVSYVPYRYKMPDAPMFIVNPATEFTENSEIMACFLVLTTLAGQPIGVGHRLGYDFNLISEGKGMYRTAYVPLSCMAGMTLDFAVDPGTDVEIYLSVIANFERGDAYADANTQNVLWKGNFSVRLESVPGFDESSPFRGVQSNLTFNQSAVLSTDQAAYGTITIKSGAVLSSSTPVTLRASSIIIEPGASISPNVKLEIAAPNGCVSGYQPTPISSLSGYCISQAYNSSERQLRLSQDQEGSMSSDEHVSGYIPLTAHPNPFDGSLTLRYSLPGEGPVRIVLLDMLGRPVRVLLDEAAQTGGAHEETFGTEGLPAGVYHAVLEAGGRRQRVKVVRAAE